MKSLESMIAQITNTMETILENRSDLKQINNTNLSRKKPINQL